RWGKLRGSSYPGTFHAHDVVVNYKVGYIYTNHFHFMYDHCFVKAVSRPGSPGPVAGAGDVINTPHGFTIQLDVKLFNPEEIKVVLTDDMLCVSGERIEEGTGGQTLKRSFARKYCIPSDIQLDSIRSHLDHHGLLVITVREIFHCKGQTCIQSPPNDV
uniref:SHSP domain-containing protein n=1 Tax=Angiostrongylus cantonensis TaxID=6313 RepID=A0A0K0DJ48_ANGCA